MASFSCLGLVVAARERRSKLKSVTRPLASTCIVVGHCRTPKRRRITPSRSGRMVISKPEFVFQHFRLLAIEAIAHGEVDGILLVPGLTTGKMAQFAQRRTRPRLHEGDHQLGAEPAGRRGGQRLCTASRSAMPRWKADALSCTPGRSGASIEAKRDGVPGIRQASSTPDSRSPWSSPSCIQLTPPAGRNRRQLSGLSSGML